MHSLKFGTSLFFVGYNCTFSLYAARKKKDDSEPSFEEFRGEMGTRGYPRAIEVSHRNLKQLLRNRLGVMLQIIGNKRSTAKFCHFVENAVSFVNKGKQQSKLLPPSGARCFYFVLILVMTTSPFWRTFSQMLQLSNTHIAWKLFVGRLVCLGTMIDKFKGDRLKV